MVALTELDSVELEAVGELPGFDDVVLLADVGTVLAGDELLTVVKIFAVVSFSTLGDVITVAFSVVKVVDSVVDWSLISVLVAPIVVCPVVEGVAEFEIGVWVVTTVVFVNGVV